jgi:hypothetical protein
MGNGDAEKPDEVGAVREQPGFNLPYSHTEAHVGRRVRQPGRPEWRGTVCILVQIHQDKPRPEPRRTVISPKQLLQIWLAIFSIDLSRYGSHIPDKTPEHRFIHESFNRA